MKPGGWASAGWGAPGGGGAAASAGWVLGRLGVPAGEGRGTEGSSEIFGGEGEGRGEGCVSIGLVVGYPVPLVECTTARR